MNRCWILRARGARTNLHREKFAIDRFENRNLEILNAGVNQIDRKMTKIAQRRNTRKTLEANEKLTVPQNPFPPDPLITGRITGQADAGGQCWKHIMKTMPAMTPPVALSCVRAYVGTIFILH